MLNPCSQLDWIWNQLAGKLYGIPIRDFPLDVGSASLVAVIENVPGEKALLFCLLAFPSC